MHRRLLSITALAFVAATSDSASAYAVSTPDALPFTQLPRTVKPLHYDIAITPDAAASTFAAQASIDIDVLEPTTSITLNAADLAFQRVQLRSKTGATKAWKTFTASIHADNDAQTARFDFGRKLAKGHYTLAIDYSGLVNTQAAGLFALDYDTPAGRKRALYTQFENSDARRMIPSWDEPAYKATYTLHVIAPTGQMAISNMPVARQKNLADGRSEIDFAPSPNMSSYLLFFALGDFDRVTATFGKTELGVVTRKGVSNQAAFVLDAARDILKEYNDYFGVPYPLPKLDNVAAPGNSQFFGAMENWGAIFTFEHSMLLDPAFSTVNDKQDVFETVAHEMAHQWFGDLVTMRWWDDLWLNEGFATWMESRMTARLHPEWDTRPAAVSSAQHAMEEDALSTTHAIVQHIDTVEQASQAFDAITYSKGEAVIHMLEGYVGEDAWRAGVRAYMQAHAYGNTTSDDLWREIDRAAGQPVSEIAHDFTLQPGVPLIRVDDVQCIDGQSLVTLTQSEFSVGQPDKKPLQWHVPVIAQVLGSPQMTRAVVADGKATLHLPGCGPVLVNAGQSGYFHTQYADAQLHALMAAFPGLSPVDQLGILGDSWAFGLAGTRPIGNFLDLAKATPVDADPKVWAKIIGAFSRIHHGFHQKPEEQKAFDAFAVAQLAPVFAKVGWNPKAEEQDAIANLRSELIEALASFGDAGVITEAHRLFAVQASDPASVPVALRRAVIDVIGTNADANAWDALHESARKEQSPLVKEQMYDLLASAMEDAQAKRALELALTDEPGATTSAEMISRVALSHPDMAFDFAIAHLGQVSRLVDSSSRSRYLPSLASHSSDPAIIGKLNAYADANLAPSARHDVEIAIAMVKLRIQERSSSQAAIHDWLHSVQ
jgi:aminopeptidase N